MNKIIKFKNSSKGDIEESDNKNLLDIKYISNNHSNEIANKKSDNYSKSYELFIENKSPEKIKDPKHKKYNEVDYQTRIKIMKLIEKKTKRDVIAKQTGAYRTIITKFGSL